MWMDENTATNSHVMRDAGKIGCMPCTAWGGGCSVMTFNPADETQCFDVGGTLMRTRFGFINTAGAGNSSPDLQDS